MLLPVFRSCLFSRVCPEIGIVDIHQQLHAVFCRTLAYETCGIYVAVSAAVSVSVAVVGFVPDSHTDIVHAMFGEGLEDILFIAVFVLESYA